MIRCAKCNVPIAPTHGRWFAGAPIPSGVQKCQRCGPFTAAERALVIRKMQQGQRFASAAPCKCGGVRR